MEIVNNMSHNKIEEALVQCKPVTISLQRCIDQLVSLHCGRIGFTIQYGDLAKSPTAKKKKLKKKLYDAIFSRYLKTSIALPLMLANILFLHFMLALFLSVVLFFTELLFIPRCHLYMCCFLLNRSEILE